MKMFPASLLIFVCLYSWRAQADVQDILWQAKTNTEVAPYSEGSGSTLSKISWGTAAWNADASSIQTITADGSVEFRFDQTNKRMALGLSHDDAAEGFGELDYAIVVNASTASGLVPGNIFIHENGANIGVVGTLATSDVFRIEREGTNIRYLRNGVLLRATTARSVGSLLVDTSFYDNSGSISGCRITRSGFEEDVVWDRATSGTDSYNPDLGSTFKHSTSGATWEGAGSSKMIHADGYLKFKFGNTGKRMVIGFAPTDPDKTITSIPYGIEATGATNNFRVFDQDETLATGTFAVTDAFTIKRTGTSVTYYKNDALLATSDDPSTGRLFLDVAATAASATIEACRYSGADPGEPVGWKTATSVAQGPAFLTPEGFRKCAKSSATAAWDAGTSSYNAISKAGQVEFRFSHIDKQLVVGLSTTDAGVTDATVQYGIKALGNGTAQVIESGTLLAAPVSFSVSDRFCVRRTNQVIYYEKNGVAFHQHGIAGVGGTAPLVVDVAFYSPGAQLDDARITGNATDVLWRNPTGVVETHAIPGNGSSLAKVNATAAWNSGAVSQAIITDDGAAEFSPLQLTKQIAVGLGNNDLGFDQSSPYNVLIGNAGTYVITENGSAVTSAANYAVNDTFRIERVNGRVKYYKNDTLLRTAPGSSTGPLFLDTAFQSAGNAAGTSMVVGNVQMYAPGPDSDGDGMHDGWEYQIFTSLDGALQSGGAGFEDDFDRDGLTNLEEFLQQTDPKDYFNGVLPDLRIASGDRQESLVNEILPQPLVIEVRDGPLQNAPLLPDAPVVFSIQGVAGSARLGLSATGPFDLTVAPVLYSDPAAGQAQVWLKQPNSNFATTTVRATATSGATTTFKEFKAFTTTLLGFWKFDETQWSTTFADSSIITINAPGTLIEYPQLVKGLGGSGIYSPTDKAVLFNGTTQFGEVANTNKLSLLQNGNQFTIAAWIHIPVNLPLGSGSDYYPIVSKWSGSSAGYELGLRGGSGNGLSFRFVTNAGVVVKELIPSSDQRAILTDGFPHVVSITRDPVDIGLLYVDGILVGTLANFTGGTSNIASLMIGKNREAAPKYFRGVLDDIKIWARQLSTGEMMGLRRTFDSDNDGLRDTWEFEHFGTLANDGTSDDDGDGDDDLNNADEYALGTNPFYRDTDGDGITDGLEVSRGLNPTMSDTDGDGMSDGDEDANGMNPLVAASEDTAGTYLQLTLYTPLK